MIVRWEKRGERYYAYARESIYEAGRQRPVKTRNRYLGNVIQKAVSTYYMFAEEEKITASKIAKDVHYLYNEGERLGVPLDERLPIDKDAFYCRLVEAVAALQIQIMDADTIEKRIRASGEAAALLGLIKESERTAR